jgi:hypothetical protein
VNTSQGLRNKLIRVFRLIVDTSNEPSIKRRLAVRVCVSHLVEVSIGFVQCSVKSAKCHIKTSMACISSLTASPKTPDASSAAEPLQWISLCQVGVKPSGQSRVKT